MISAVKLSVKIMNAHRKRNEDHKITQKDRKFLDA